MENFSIVRSARKTVGIRVNADGSVVVRAPRLMSCSAIEAVVDKHGEWIRRQRARMQRRAELFPEPTEEERRILIERAKKEIPPLVEKYAAIMGVQPAGITVTSARTRFGSCSSKNALSFSWRLMRYPAATVEAVVVHELCHIIHKNHQKAFYVLLRSILPDYDERTEVLKE